MKHILISFRRTRIIAAAANGLSQLNGGAIVQNSTSPNYSFRQSITNVDDVNITSVTVTLSKLNGVVDTGIKMRILDSGATTILYDSTNSYATKTDLSTTPALYTFNITGTLSAGTVYIIEIYMINQITVNVSNYFSIWGTTSSSYAGGQGYRYDNSNALLTPLTSDIMFDIH